MHKIEVIKGLNRGTKPNFYMEKQAKLKNFFTLFSQGIKQEGDENAYERTSDTYPDLVTLLKSRSPHFAENINKEVQWNTGRCTFLALFL